MSGRDCPECGAVSRRSCTCRLKEDMPDLTISPRSLAAGNEYKALFVSDIHMSNSLPHAKATGSNGLTDRLEDQLALWRQLGSIIDDHNIHALHVVGDLFDHGKVDVITLAETAKAIKGIALKCPVFLIPGNHDAHSTNGERFNLEAFATLSNNIICCVDKTEPYSPPYCHDWLRFWMCEYAPVERTRAKLAAMREIMAGDAPIDMQNILLIHNAISGCKHGGWVCDTGLDADEVCRGFLRVIAGHFHTHQSFGPDNCGMYLSAPMHHRFDDHGREAMSWMGTFKRGKPPQFTPFHMGAPRFHEIEYGDDLSGSLAHLRDFDYVRIKAEVTHADWVTLKPVMQEIVSELVERGMRASALHKPLYHHTTRLKPTTSTMSVASIESSVESYVDSEHVLLGDLDRATLIELAHSIIAEARHAKR